MTAARQLHLFHGKRQRGQTAPAPSEFASQSFLVSVIRRWLNPQWRFCHVPLGEYRDPIAASRCQRLGTMPGWPDLQFAGPGARMAFLELKRRGGRLSPAQQAMRAHLERCGFDYLCTDSVELAIEWLQQRDVLRSGIHVQ